MCRAPLLATSFLLVIITIRIMLNKPVLSTASMPSMALFVCHSFIQTLDQTDVEYWSPRPMLECQSREKQLDN